jgi:hypothetical protein
MILEEVEDMRRPITISGNVIGEVEIFKYSLNILIICTIGWRFWHEDKT